MELTERDSKTLEERIARLEANERLNNIILGVVVVAMLLACVGR